MKKDPLANSSVNPHFVFTARKIKDINYFLSGLKKADRYVLSQAITLLESTSLKKRDLALKLLSELPAAEDTLRIGITGSPGVGKSTFIDAFGTALLGRGFKPAVLAIDPSSARNKGSILGDKTRMVSLMGHNEAFVRPSPSSSSLGGTADMTREAITLCEAAGFNIILIETVGIGQSETEVAQMTDLNMLLLQPGSGDEMQGIKRGIMEFADLFVVNKADGPQQLLAKQSQKTFQQAVHLFSHDLEGWDCPVLLASASERTGLREILEAVEQYFLLAKSGPYFENKRKEQQRYWFEKNVTRTIQQTAFRNREIKRTFDVLEKEIEGSKTSLFAALKKMQEIITRVFTQ